MPLFAAFFSAVAVFVAPSYTRAQAPERTDVSSGLKSGRLALRLDAAQAVIEHRATAPVRELLAASRRDPNPEARARLLMAAYEVDRASATPALIAALSGDASPLVRSIAGQLLSRSGPSDPVRAAFLASLARETDPDVRRVVVFGLGAHPHPDSQKALAGAAADADPETRRRAGLALIRHPKSADRDRVLDALERDGDASISRRIRAARRPAGGGPK